MRTLSPLLALVVICFAYNAGAQSLDEEAIEENSENPIDAEAKIAFDKGKALFHDKKYIEASNAFREANRLKPSWKLMHNIGQAEAAGKRYGLALEAFESYLVIGGDEIQRERQWKIQNEITRLRGLVGSFSVKAREGSIILIDDIERGTTPLPGNIRVAAGVVHQLVVRNGDEILIDRPMRLGSGENSVIDADEPPETEPVVVPEPMPPQEPVQVMPITPPDDSNLKPVGWTLFGVGAATAVAGVITGVATLSKASDLGQDCPENLCPESQREAHESAQNLATATNVLLPVGAALAVTGLVLVLVGGNDKETETPVAVVPGPLSLSIKGRF